MYCYGDCMTGFNDDFVISAANNAKMGLVEAKLAIIPGAGEVVFLPSMAFAHHPSSVEGLHFLSTPNMINEHLNGTVHVIKYFSCVKTWALYTWVYTIV